jgi:hypothetical protein
VTRPRLVALRALKLGDLLTALPALRALADAHPDHHRVLGAPAWLAPLVAHCGVVQEQWHVASPEAMETDGASVDVAVNLHGRGPQSTRALASLRPRALLAFRHDGVPESICGPEWRAGEHDVARWCRLLRESGIAANPARLGLADPGCTIPDAAVGATLLHPGASSPARRWPMVRWVRVARAERAEGRRVVVTGAREDRDDALAIAAMAGLPESAVLAGRTSLLELVTLVARSSRVVSGDTGIAHLATATGTPSVVLFGPVSPGEWGPPRDRPQHVALWSGRTGDPHGERVDPGLLELDVVDVLVALRSLPARG